MHGFRYIGKRLYCEGVAVDSLARKFGTPLYVYSQGTLTDHFQKLDRAFTPVDHMVCFAMKSNSNLAVLRVLANLGAGFDIVSGGELQRVIAAGGDPRKCVFAGVGKTASEIEFALRRGVYSFNIESEAELDRINDVAGRIGKVAPIAVRVNPDVSAHTHAKITTGTYENKFGIALERVEEVYARAARLKNVRARGVQMHLGSQITTVAPFAQGVQKVLSLVKRLQEHYDLEFLDIGGGIGIVYDPALASGSAQWWKSSTEARHILTPAKYAERLVPLLKPLNLRILVEPGRFISGNAGILVTRVEYVKRTGRKNFLIVDAAMNDLIRPAFYEAYHEIVPLHRKNGTTIEADVVGPICESGDFFAKGRALPPMREGDHLALLSAGAYGSVMASNYNTRSIAAEVLVHGTKSAIVRERQPVKQIWASEKVAGWLK